MLGQHGMEQHCQQGANKRRSAIFIATWTIYYRYYDG